MSVAKAALLWNEKPPPDECSPAHAAYIEQVPAGDLFETLARQPAELAALVGNLTPEQWGTATPKASGLCSN